MPTMTDITTTLESALGDESVSLLRKLGELSAEFGTRAYVVGGVVRDALLGIPNEDLDVVVEERGEKFAAFAAGRLGGDVKAHTRFGTAIVVLPGKHKVDVATSRSEVYARPGALPTVRPGGIAEDLLRRDFTINSMAASIDPNDFGALVDLYSGLRDLRDGVLRVLTDASFVDDPTRVLRAVRFAARFGFSLEDRSRRLLVQAVESGGLTTVSGERIMNEMRLIVSERKPWPPVERLIDWGILRAIDGSWSIGHDVGRVFEGLDQCMRSKPCEGLVAEANLWSLRLLAMLWPLPPADRAGILERLRAGRRVRELGRSLERFETEALAELRSPGPMRRSAIYNAASPVAVEVLVLALATGPGEPVDGRLRRFLGELRGTTTSVDGGDLAALGISEGSAVGEVLSELLRARLDGEVTSEAEERMLAEKLAKNLDARKNSC